jgi:hypothetical protein
MPSTGNVLQVGFAATEASQLPHTLTLDQDGQSFPNEVLPLVQPGEPLSLIE